MDLDMNPARKREVDEKLRADLKARGENREKVGTKLDEWIVILGTGLVASSAGFLQLADMETQYPFLVLISWFCIVIGVGSVLFATYKVFDTEGEFIKHGFSLLSGKNLDEIEKKEIKGFFSEKFPRMLKFENRQYYFSFTALFIGVVLLAVFVGSNIFQKNEHIRQENQTKKIQAELEIEKLKKEIRLLDIEEERALIRSKG